MNKQITVLCPAKINLSLDVVSKRADGYHNIESVMHSVSLCDRIRVSLGGSGITITSNLSYIPRDEKNVAYKAASRFFARTRATYGVKIHIDKKIPVAAGLAGGSTDAAGVIRALNELTGVRLSLSELIKIGGSIGADIPFCLDGGCQFASGIGENLTSLPPLPECFIVLCKLPVAHSTKAVYELLDSRPIERRPDTPSVITAVSEGRTEGLRACAHNVFEPVAVQMTPEIENVRTQLEKFCPVYLSLSGTGPTYYAVFSDKKAAVSCEKAMQKLYREVYIVTPVGHGVKFI